MCGIVSSIIGAAIAAATSIGTSAYNNKQQKKAEKRQQAAQEKLLKQSKQQQQTVSETAKNAQVNEPVKKRTLSALRIPTNNSSPTVNTADTSVGLNIPM